MSKLVIRESCLRLDASRILELMKELATFEGYLNSFAVTEELLIKFCSDEKCNVIVAEVDNKVEAILVYFFQSFTYDLSPWLIIKELYVSQMFRVQGIGEALFD